MALKKLEIIGFKSFAKKTSLTFASSITAIVGPNGSGKSNAAEAFRFVLGEQSMKSLRGKRTEDLIFSGSAKTGRSNRANVKLTFDNTNRLLDVDFDEVVVERTIHRDASSEYAINGSTVRLKDIQELLAGANVGSSGHHIISQGAADRVLSVNPRERREMIEDALGLRVYQYKIEESTKKLEKTRQNIKEVESLRREIKPHLNFLKKQVEKVQRAQEIQNELTDRYKEYFRRETLYVEGEEKRITEERKPLVQEKQRYELEKRTAEERLAELDAETTGGSGTERFEAELRSVREKKDELARTIGRLEGGIEAEERRLASAVSVEKDEQFFSESEVHSVLDVIEKRLEEAEHLSVLEDVYGVLRGLREKIRAFWGTQVAVDHPERESPDVTLRQLQHDLAGREEEMYALSQREEVLQSQIREQKKEFEEEQHESREVERSIFQLREKLQKLSGQIGRLEGDAERLELIREERERELLEARALVGREAVHYTEALLKDTEGNMLTPEEAVKEERAVQEARKRAIEKLKIRLEEAGAGSGEEVLKEFEHVSERDQFLEREVLDLEQSAESLVVLIGELTETLEQNFKNGLEKINEAFGEFFSVMFGGGSASLRLVVEKRKRRAADDILGLDDDEEGKVEEEGIEIGISLPRKKIRGLEMLSGGERALTSIALIFAMSQVNPPPFLILDETDAALDEANSRRYGDMIERLSERSQLILITHNRETMSRADVLYGVTMGGDGVSQVLSVGFTEATKVAK